MNAKRKPRGASCLLMLRTPSLSSSSGGWVVKYS